MNQITSLHPYWLVITALAFALIPIAIGICTSYLKISIVLGMLRNGLGTQHAPSNLVVMALSLALTLLIMGSTIDKSLQGVDLISQSKTELAPNLKSLKKLQPLFEPWREFMQQHAGEHELATLQAATLKEGSEDQITAWVLIPAFLLTELKEAFAMGFILLLPFLVIDLIVSNILAGMGMYMLSPAMISLPLKLLFFVISDGWLLLSRSLIVSYNL